ncbi:hypothetical protein [Psychromonas ossibalaenae]|uniref:hypothetical protein n=1 Tax=Psychromonas ossibalaenae TaxID=444922 RepID=UPI000360FA99|nr:hypothetical protein [Psychromonas ossibalaenae]
MTHISAGALQTVPLTERFIIYPGLYLGGLITDQKNIETGTTTGVDLAALTTTIQIYSKFQVNNKIWVNVNPAYTTSLYGIKTNTFDLEASIGYQLTPTLTTRIFHNNNVGVGNYNDDTYESVTRMELNYAF